MVFVCMYRIHSPCIIDLKMLLGCADEKCKYWYRLSGSWKVFVSRMFVKGI